MYHAMALGSRGASPCPSSSFTFFWSALYTRMGTSPPTQNAPTYVTDSASSVAAPASAAFPPCSNILIPAAVAAGLPETTTPRLPVATLGPLRLAFVLVACGQLKDTNKTRRTDDIEMTLRMMKLPLSTGMKLAVNVTMSGPLHASVLLHELQSVRHG